MRSMTRLWPLVLCCVLAAPAFAAEPVEIVEQKGTWEMAYGDVYYRVYGHVQNKSDKPVKYVKLELELLDQDGKPLVSRTGLNQKAEVLGEVEGYQSDLTPEQQLEKVQPIAPGEKEFFRIGVGKNEMPKTPKFKSYRLKIVEVK